MMDEAWKFLASQGVLGICVGGLAVAYIRKDRELAQAHADRIADAAATMKILVEAQTGTRDLANDVKELAEKVSERSTR